MAVYRSKQVPIREIESMEERGELDLTPAFQRRLVWSDKARSYLIDTILRGKPIPTLYLRTTKNPRTKATRQEVVDGQQRLHTVLSFLKDAFVIDEVHYPDFGHNTFDQLPPSAQEDIREYEFTITFLLDIPDKEVWDIFARLNKYPVRLNHQELRNSQYFGDFKSTAYDLANEFNTFWLSAGIFTVTQIARMAEAEFVSELLIAASSGIKGKSKAIIDKAYKSWDPSFPNRTVIAERFRHTVDLAGAIIRDLPPDSSLRRVPLFYSLFCALYHSQYSLPALAATRKAVKAADIPKVQVTLAKIDEIFEVDKADIPNLPRREREFRLATDVHTIHAGNRLIRTRYILRLIQTALRK